MEKEIYEQIDSTLRAISLGGRILSDNSVKLGGLEGFKRGLVETIAWFEQPENLALYKSGIYNL